MLAEDTEKHPFSQLMPLIVHILGTG